MTAQPCRDRLRFRLSDDSGDLRFEAFAIANAAECRGMEDVLRVYLVGRSLVDVDLDYLRSLSCPVDGANLFAMIEQVEEYQRLFVETTEKARRRTDSE